MHLLQPVEQRCQLAQGITQRLTMQPPTLKSTT
jgi:hypothetical protein